MGGSGSKFVPELISARPRQDHSTRTEHGAFSRRVPLDQRLSTPTFCCPRYRPFPASSLFSAITWLTDLIVIMSSTPGSRHRRHASRKSQSSTPVQSQATPKSSRPQQQNGNAVPSSSPLFFGSSPAKSTQQSASQRSQSNLGISSPLRTASNAGERETTPRPSGAIPPGT